MTVKVLFLFCVLYTFHCIRAAEVSSSVPVCSENPITTGSDSFGYELLLTKLEDLESKFWNMWLEMKEQNEQIMRNHSRLEITHQGMMWMLNRMEDAVGHNLTTVMDRSWQILQQQQSFANFDNWKQSVLAMISAKKKSTNCVEQTNQQLIVTPNSNEQLDAVPKSLKSCSDAPANVSGKYMIHPLGFQEPFEVYCEQGAFDGGWIVVQYRFDGSVDFYRNWTEYRNGFGSLDGEFWLGLEKLHSLTKGGDYVLIIELKSFHGNYKFARYDGFEIGSEEEKYSLKKFGNYSGTAGDSLSYHKNGKFSTMDRDNDDYGGVNCALEFKGAWWYKTKYDSNLNGLHQNVNNLKSLNWYHFYGGNNGLKYSRMMVRKV